MKTVKYENFIKDLIGIEEDYPRISTTVEKLCSDCENPFLDIYPEKKKLLKDSQHCTYYRIESGTAADHCTHRRTVIVYFGPGLTDKEKFKRYIGLYPEDFAKAEYIENGYILPLMAKPELYLNEKLKTVYEPIFKKLEGNESLYPVYANRMEDSLLLSRDLKWDDYRQRQIKKTKRKISSEQLQVGKLSYNSQVFFGERIAWLKLLNLQDIAKDIEKLAKENQEFAKLVAFCMHGLYVAPVLYSRKTTQTMSSKFDLPLYENVINGFLKYKKGKKLRDIVKEYCQTGDLLKGYVTIKESIEHPVCMKLPIAKEYKYRCDIPSIIKDCGLDKVRDDVNEKIPGYKYTILNDPSKTIDIHNKMKDAGENLSEAYAEAFADNRKFGWGIARNVLLATIPVVSTAVMPTAGILIPFLSIAIRSTTNKYFEECKGDWVDKYYEKHPFLKYVPITDVCDFDVVGGSKG